MMKIIVTYALELSDTHQAKIHPGKAPQDVCYPLQYARKKRKTNHFYMLSAFNSTISNHIISIFNQHKHRKTV